MERFDDPWSDVGGTVLKGFDTAQICTNGHVINQYAASQPGYNSPHCAKCGAPTITKCPKCENRIRGYYHVPGVVSLCGPDPAPGFCAECGAAFPWTEERLSAAREFIRELDRLDDTEKGLLSRSLDDLVRDTPNTTMAVQRFKKYAAKAGTSAVEGLRTILVEVMVEAAKRQIWPS
jgi:hypothetical protein